MQSINSSAITAQRIKVCHCSEPCKKHWKSSCFQHVLYEVTQVMLIAERADSQVEIMPRMSR